MAEKLWFKEGGPCGLLGEPKPPPAVLRKGDCAEAAETPETWGLLEAA